MIKNILIIEKRNENVRTKRKRRQKNAPNSPLDSKKKKMTMMKKTTLKKNWKMLIKSAPLRNQKASNSCV